MSEVGNTDLEEEEEDDGPDPTAHVVLAVQ
jgi:hypothetical protein